MTQPIDRSWSIEDRSRERYIVSFKSGYVIAKVARIPGSARARLKNAKLIAAAPELLEALSQCVEQMRAYNLTPHPKASSGGAWRYISAQETAKKAIAKAT